MRNSRNYQNELEKYGEISDSIAFIIPDESARSVAELYVSTSFLNEKNIPDIKIIVDNLSSKFLKSVMPYKDGRTAVIFKY